jgi:hypothetical protein
MEHKNFNLKEAFTRAKAQRPQRKSSTYGNRHPNQSLDKIGSGNCLVFFAFLASFARNGSPGLKVFIMALR